MGALMAAFLAEIGLITYRDITRNDPLHQVAGLPLPADYTAAIVLFGALGLAPKDGPDKVAALLGWAFVIATALNLTPALLNPSGKTSAQAAAPTANKPPPGATISQGLTTTKGATLV